MKKISKWVLIAFLYLSGCIVSYIDWRESLIEINGVYTINNRYDVIFCSSFSWLSVVCLEIAKYNFENGDKEAKW